MEAGVPYAVGKSASGSVAIIPSDRGDFVWPHQLHQPPLPGWFLVMTMCIAPLQIVAQVPQATPERTSTGSAGSQVAVYIDGAIRGVSTGDQDQTDAVTGTGSLGVGVTTQRVDYLASIVVASTADTIASDPGTFILTPVSGQSLRSGLIDVHHRTLFGKPLGVPFGLHAYGFASQARLLRPSDSTVAGVVVAGMGTLLRHDIVKGNLSGQSDNHVRLSVEGGPSFRIVAGDVGAGLRKAFRQEVFGSPSRFYGGLELGLQVEFGVVTGAFALYFYDDFSKNSSVPGVTGGQLVASFAIGGPVFTGSLP